MQHKQLKLKDVPVGFYLERLYRSTEFTHLKVEMEGNQDNYDIDDDAEYFEDSLMDRAGLHRADFQYINAYNDGSVNTEVTFTVTLDERGVEKVEKMLTAFNSMIEDTYKAGMHIAVLARGAYEGGPELNRKGLDNLNRQLSPILPFIQLLGQSTELHRGVGYCSNRVGESKAGYPAVYIQENRRIEFRFFHVAYEQPALFKHYLEVISRMLEYYDDPTKKVKLHGGTGTYRHLLSTEEFNYYVQSNAKRLPETLAFSDIFGQFTGHYADEWKMATGFEPKSLQYHWTRKEHREALRRQRQVKEIAAKRLKNEKVADWLVGGKESLYDEINVKGINKR